MTQVEFTKGMTLLTVAYPKFEVDQMTMEVWYSFFEDIRADVFIAAVKSFVRNSKFAPTVTELLKHCEESKMIILNDTLKLMYQQGYFHQGVDDNQAYRNYEKANQWLQRGTEPEWLKEDMRRYRRMQLGQHDQLKLN
ncbi:MAG: replicative helicase loader/inhibitor [Turicibacter sp.]